MLRRECRVKGLDAERARVRVPSRRRHQRDRAEASNVAVVQGAAVVEAELERGVAALGVGERAVGWGVEQHRAGEARLHDYAVAGGKVEDDELGAAPRA